MFLFTYFNDAKVADAEALPFLIASNDIANITQRA